MKHRIIICHGTYSSPRDSWYAWLAKSLEAQGHTCVIPEFPTPKEQSLQMWKRELWKYIGKLEGDHILVGHGIGAAFVINTLQLAFRKISATFLVSGYCRLLGNPEFDGIEQGFIEGPFDWEAIKANASYIKIYHPENDSLVPKNLGEELASNLSTTPVLVSGIGHIDSQNQVKEFPRLLEDIVKFIQSKETNALSHVNQ